MSIDYRVECKSHSKLVNKKVYNTIIKLKNKYLFKRRKN